MDKRKHPVDQNFLESKRSKTYCIIEHDFMNCISVPSIENIAIVNIVTRLLKQIDIVDAIKQHSSKFIPRFQKSSFPEDRINSLNQIEEKFLEKPPLLSLPNHLQAKVAFFIKAIVIEVLKWMSDHSSRYTNCRRRIDYMDCIHWTMEGTIDKAKTLKSELDYNHFEAYTIREAFYIACQYCLEDQIYNLWEKLPEEIKEDFCNKFIHKEYKDHLVSYRTCSIKNELPRLFDMIKSSDHRNIYDRNHSVYKNMFRLSIAEGNKLAVKYFWNKLTEVEINFVELTSNVIKQICTDMYKGGNHETDEHNFILCFLLSKMNDQDQIREVFTKYSSTILNAYFSYWPWQKFLLPTIRVMWDCLEERDYVDLVSVILEQIKIGRCSKKLLKELWRDSPTKFKNHLIKVFIKYGNGPVILWKLFELEDVDAVKLILKATNKEEKKQIIFRSIKNTELRKLIYAEKLAFLNKLIEETLSLECDINNFKEKVILEYGRHLCNDWIHDGNLLAVDKFFDWGYVSEDQIYNLKKKLIDEVKIAHSLIPLGNYELISKFIHWYFSTEEEVNQFKKVVAYEMFNGYGIVERLSCKDWALFERFLDWCFNSDEEINQFRLYISQYDKMVSVITHAIVSGYNFIFATEFLNWCLSCDKEVGQFKKKFILSKDGSDMFERFVSTYKKTEYVYWKSVKKLIQWYYPLDMEITDALKEEVKRVIDRNFARSKLYTAERKEQALSNLLPYLSLDGVEGKVK